MAIYPFDYTSPAMLLASIKAGLTTAGILTTVHRDTSTNLIVTTTRSTRVVRLTIQNQFRLAVFYGTSYASGDNINDSVALYELNALSTGSAGAVVVTGDVWGIFERRVSGTNIGGFICGKLNNLAETQIMWGWFSGQVGPLLHDADARVRMEAAFYAQQIVSADDKYYMSEIPCVSPGARFLSMGVKGVKALHKGMNINSAYEIVGNDVVVPGGGCNGNAAYMGDMSLYIPNGASWQPA